MKEDRLLELFTEKAPAAIAIFDNNMNYILASHKWYKDYGIDSDVIGRSHYEVFPEITEEWKEIHRQCLQGNSAKNDEDRFEHDGEVQWLKWEISPWNKEDGSLGGIIMFTEDITSSKKTRDLLEAQNTELESMKVATLTILESLEKEKNSVREDKERLGLILESIADGVIVLDKERKINLINHVAAEYLGLEEEDLTGKVYSEHFLFNDALDQPEVDFVERVYDSGESQTLKPRSYLLKPNSEKLPVSGSSASLVIHDSIKGCVIVFRDNSREQKIDEIKSDFVSVASHQLRTPLTAVKWYAELLSSEIEENEGALELVKEITSSNDRMITLVNDLLNVSRIEKNATTMLEKTEFNITELLNEVMLQNKPLAEERNITFKLEVEENQVVMADRKKLFEVFNNLINNAIKYSREDAEVLITCFYSDNSIKISVEDKGIGIPVEQRGKVFSKFFRADNAKELETDGNGLGLYIVKSFVEEHGGTIRFETELDQGTKFIIELPK